jgi:hypothetical protein
LIDFQGSLPEFCKERFDDALLLLGVLVAQVISVQRDSRLRLDDLKWSLQTRKLSQRGAEDLMASCHLAKRGLQRLGLERAVDGNLADSAIWSLPAPPAQGPEALLLRRKSEPLDPAYIHTDLSSFLNPVVRERLLRRSRRRDR